MEKNTKQALLVIIPSILLIAAIIKFDALMLGFKYIVNLALPILIGLILAFILNVPINSFERLITRLSRKRKKRPQKKTVHMISFGLTLICVVLVFTLLATIVFPALADTFDSISVLIRKNLPTWLAWLEENDVNTESVSEWFKSSEVSAFLGGEGLSASALLGSVANIASSTVSRISSVIIGIIIAIYTQLSRDTLGRQAKKLLYAYLKKPTADRFYDIALRLKDAYTKYLSGQCLEAIILGVLIALSFVIFRLPYAGLIGCVTAACAMIPYVGAFISMALAVLLSLLVSPEKALVCLVVYLAVQFIETQLIYPHVVGGSVGLSPLWTMIAVLIGGGLFGLLGMIFFIPLVAVVYELVSENTNKKLSEDHILIPKGRH